jgi:hypothetical protein
MVCIPFFLLFEHVAISIFLKATVNAVGILGRWLVWHFPLLEGNRRNRKNPQALV